MNLETWLQGRASFKEAKKHPSARRDLKNWSKAIALLSGGFGLFAGLSYLAPENRSLASSLLDGSIDKHFIRNGIIGAATGAGLGAALAWNGIILPV